MSNPVPQNQPRRFIPFAILAGVVVFAMLGAGGLYALLGQRDTFGSDVMLSPAYAEMDLAVCGDPQVVERIGRPISTLSAPRRQHSGRVNSEGESFQYDIYGSGWQTTAKDKDLAAIVSGVATSAGEKTWKISDVTVTFTDGSVVSVPVPSGRPAFGETP